MPDDPSNEAILAALRGGPPPDPAAAAAPQNANPQGAPVHYNAPEWVPWTAPEQTPEQILQGQQEGRGGPPTQDTPTRQQEALLGHFGEGERETAGQSLSNYVNKNAGAFGDAPPNTQADSFRPPMTGEAQAFEDRQNFAIDPNRIGFNGSDGFQLDTPGGPDPFGGQLPKDMSMSQMPKALQPLLGPSFAQYYGTPYDLVAKGGAPSWTRFFAPPGNQLSSSSDHLWPGITHYDAWHRSLGEYPNLYS